MVNLWHYTPHRQTVAKPGISIYNDAERNSKFMPTQPWLFRNIRPIHDFVLPGFITRIFQIYKTFVDAFLWLNFIDTLSYFKYFEYDGNRTWFPNSQRIGVCRDIAIGFSFSWLALCIGGRCLDWLAVGLSRFLIYLALSPHLIIWSCEAVCPYGSRVCHGLPNRLWVSRFKCRYLDTQRWQSYCYWTTDTTPLMRQSVASRY